jgi:hypothetical protein
VLLHLLHHNILDPPKFQRGFILQLGGCEVLQQQRADAIRRLVGRKVADAPQAPDS